MKCSKSVIIIHRLHIRLLFILENREVHATLNGLHASGLYIGVLVSALFIEAPLRKYGFRPMIITGGIIVGISLLLFPVLESIWIWFLLRLLVGVGDNALHFSTQTWLTQTTPQHKLGIRNGASI